MGITRLASDHLPVIAEFKLQEETPATTKTERDDQAEPSAENINFLI